MAKRILVVDDKQMIRDLLQDILEALGCVSVCATNGAEAIELYKEALGSDCPFDGVIMDLKMPEIDGEEAMQKLLAIDPEVKAIVSSGYFDDPIMANFQEHGFMAVLQKPYGVDAVKQVFTAIFV